MASLKEGEDYYINEQGLYVFTTHYLLTRGYCCGSGCKHCPYDANGKPVEEVVAQQHRGK